MRVVLLAHRAPGMDDNVPSPAEVLHIATEGGARTTPFGDEIGALRKGRAADITLIDWRKIAAPYIDPHTPPINAILHRAKTSAVDTVIVGGEIIYRDGRFTRIDKDEILAELAKTLDRPLQPHEEVRRKLSQDLFDHVRAFYDGYLENEGGEPFDIRNSRR